MTFLDLIICIVLADFAAAALVGRYGLPGGL